MITYIYKERKGARPSPSPYGGVLRTCVLHTCIVQETLFAKHSPTYHSHHSEHTETHTSHSVAIEKLPTRLPTAAAAETEVEDVVLPSTVPVGAKTAVSNGVALDSAFDVPSEMGAILLPNAIAGRKNAVLSAVVVVSVPDASADVVRVGMEVRVVLLALDLVGMGV